MNAKFLGLLIIATMALKVTFSQEYYTIKGSISGLKRTDTIYLKKSNNVTTDIISKCVAKNGKLSFKGCLDKIPEAVYLFTKNKKPIEILLDGSTIKITGNYHNWPNIKVKGSQLQSEYVAYNNIMKSIWEQWDSIKIAFEDAQRLGDTLTRNNLSKLFQLNSEKNIVAKRRFIENHFNSLYSPLIILESKHMTPIEKNYFYNRLSNHVKRSYYGGKLNDYLDSLLPSSIKTGNIIPDFTSLDQNGYRIHLNEIFRQSHLTLIDFWASWCKPCRAETPNIKKVYEKFHDNGFNVISISLDIDKQTWLKAIHENSMNWKHFSELKGKFESSAVKFGISGIPASILVDSSGKIFAIDAPSATIRSGRDNLKGSALYKAVEDFLGKLDE